MWLLKSNFHTCWFKNVNARRQFSLLFKNNSKVGSQDQVIPDFVDNDSDYKTLINQYLDIAEHKCFIIHPYVKWGPQKTRTSKPEYEMQEAIALVNSLYTWKIVDTIVVPLVTLHKKTLFGTGSLTKLVQKVRGNPSVSAVFINTGTLKNAQVIELEKQFKVPIFDRYTIVMQIFRLHATTKHAKLQVALAELPYLRHRLKQQDTDFTASAKLDVRHLMLQTREKKLKEEIVKLRSQRELLRNKRSKIELPIVAVVGYTNAGKTSLIKALTGDANLIPKDQLFATLDVTFHAGLLPSSLKVLYVDTVGFLSNLPTGLIECFKATLEDAMLADVILHVEDLSNEDFLHQRMHVMKTLEDLTGNMGIQDIKKKVICVGNKCDIYNNVEESILKVCAKEEIGVDILKQRIEEKILESANRHVISISLPIGGAEIRWMYKNATVVSMEEDPSNIEYNIVKIIISEAKLHQFKHHFVT